MSKPADTKPDPPEVEIIHPSYQPSRAELRKDLRVDATFEKVVAASLRPMKIRSVLPPKRKR